MNKNISANNKLMNKLFNESLRFYKNIENKKWLVNSQNNNIISANLLNDTVNSIIKADNIDGHFTLTLGSGVSDAVNKFEFNHINHFNNWFNKLQVSNEIAGEDSFTRLYHSSVKDYKNLYGDYVRVIDVKPTTGGCNKHKEGVRILKSSLYQYKLYNPVSKSNNCFFRAVEFLMEQKIDIKKLRKQFNIETDIAVSVDDGYKILKYLQLNYIIIQHDTNDELKQSNKYLLLKGGHYYAVVNFENVIRDGKTKRGLMTFDFETRPTEKYNVIKATGQKMYILKDTICGVHYMELKSNVKKNIIFKTDEKKSSARHFIDFLNDEATFNRSYNIIAHNGGNFDFYFLMSSMTSREMLECKIQMRGTTVIGISYRGNTFKDSYCFLTNSLHNLSNSFKIEHGKIVNMLLHNKEITSSQLCFYKPQLTFNHFLNLETNDKEFWDLYTKYCIYDCIALYEIWEKFQDCVNGLISQINPYILRQCPLMSCSTIGSHSKKIIVEVNKFKGTSNCYKSDIEKFTGINYVNKIKNVDYDKYNFLCNFKRGGISHCNQAGKHMNGITGVDIASQYPASLLHSYIPCGKSDFIYEYDKTKYGFYHLTNVKFNSRYHLKPVASSFKNVSLNWSNEYIEELYIDSYMILYLKENYGLSDFEVVRGLVSNKQIKSDKLFGKYVNSFYEQKKLQDKYKNPMDKLYNMEKYNPALRETIKLYLNALTGKLVEDPSNHYSLKFDVESNYKLGECGISKEYDENKINDWITAGIMVYSYSKRLLFEYIKCLPDDSDDVIHIETDGIYFSTEHLQTFEENLTNYSGEYPCEMGENLGNLKIEKTTTRGQVAYFLGKKFYCITMNDDYNDKSRDEKDKNIYKIKGIPQKTITEDGSDKYLVDVKLYEDVYNGKEITKTFTTLKKSLFNSDITIASLTMTRKIKPNCKYKLYE